MSRDAPDYLLQQESMKKKRFKICLFCRFMFRSICMIEENKNLEKTERLIFCNLVFLKDLCATVT